MIVRAPLRVGIVGAGRTRQGLGPYFARWFEAAGARVAAVSGRTLDGARRTADELAAAFGHPVDAAADAAALARTVDLLVVASPVATHLEGLDAALAAGVPCLCEKPLVAAEHEAAGRARIAAFGRRGLLLAENCQWPHALPALFELHPELTGAPVWRVAMGLGPIGAGAAMVADSLSHVLSVVQALAPLDDAVVHDVRATDRSATAVRNVVSFTVGARAGPVAVELHLEHCPQPPRPAWIAVNGRRVDRRIGAGYTISFVRGDGRALNVTDPLQRLVYGLVSTLESEPRERTEAFASLDVRLRLYTTILRALETD
ncbi:MAG: Gfo/Idh/MocA family oxidoreductase [Planctomycetes bacterium]|nr:Gfo/Idh/MocA family oxidoreductase [Planctomycetota bacterium]